jgi:hypothetical protein
MKPMKKIILTVVAILGLVGAIAPDAHAIVGRPLTPMSYAGVARRTARRSAYAGAAYGAAAGAAAASAATVAALPAGCLVGVPCGGVVYQAAYSGANLVYVAQ